MRRMSFSCGDKVSIRNNNRMENCIVCESIDTTDEKVKVRVVTENGKVTDKAIGTITKR